MKEALAEVDANDIEDAVVLASIYNTKGGIFWQQGELAEAIICVRRSLQLYEEVGYSWGIAVALSNLGVLHDVLGQWPAAIAYYEKAYVLQQSVGDLEHQARSLDNLGVLRMSMGLHARARQDLAAGRALRTKLGDTMGCSQSEASIAQLDLIEARSQEAVELAESALQIAESIGSDESQVYAGWVLALAHTSNGNHSAGVANAERALNLALASGISDQISDCWRALGRAKSAAGERMEAISCFEQAALMAKQQNTPYRQGLALFRLGQTLGNLENLDFPGKEPDQIQAISALQKASAIFTALGAAYDLECTRKALRSTTVWPGRCKSIRRSAVK